MTISRTAKDVLSGESRVPVADQSPHCCQLILTHALCSLSPPRLRAGTAGGIAQVLVGQPLDMLKVRLQTAPQGTYSGMGDCAMQIIKKDGPLGFYKGTLTPLLGVGLCVSIQFGVVERVKREFASANARAAGVPAGAEAALGVGPKAFPLTNPQLYTAGVAAGVANSFVAGPVEHIRIRLQTQATKVYNGPLDCARK